MINVCPLLSMPPMRMTWVSLILVMQWLTKFIGRSGPFVGGWSKPIHSDVFGDPAPPVIQSLPSWTKLAPKYLWIHEIVTTLGYIKMYSHHLLDLPFLKELFSNFNQLIFNNETFLISSCFLIPPSTNKGFIVSNQSSYCSVYRYRKWLKMITCYIRVKEVDNFRIPNLIFG